MSKYNVGDKVIVRPDLYVGMTGLGESVTSQMAALAGKIVTIRSVRYDGSYLIQEETIYNWTDAMFAQKATELSTIPKLEAGMLVVRKDGKMRIVVPSKKSMVLTDCCGANLSLSDYKSDLTFPGESTYDVEKVYGLTKGYSISNNTYERDLLWERTKPVTELTLEQVAKLAGVDVANLKIKK